MHFDTNRTNQREGESTTNPKNELDELIRGVSIYGVLPLLSPWAPPLCSLSIPVKGRASVVVHHSAIRDGLKTYTRKLLHRKKKIKMIK
jgi:hypothetical protein